jgi:hypothetical protein
MKGAPMRITACLAIALLTLVSFNSRGLTQDVPPDLSGLWDFDANPDGTTKATIDQDGTKLTMRIQGTEAGWDLEGVVNGAGEVTMTRWIPVTEFKNLSPSEVNQVLKEYGDPAHPGMLKGKVTLKYDADKKLLTGEYTRIGRTFGVSYERAEPMKLGRGRPLPDLRVASFRIEVVDGKNAAGEAIKIRLATAEVENRGAGTFEGKFKSLLRKANVFRENPEPSTYTVAYSTTELPAIEPGKKTTIEWRTDKPTGTANSPNIVESDDEITIVLDPENKIHETNERNNEYTLVKVTCGGNATAPNPQAVAWVNKHSDDGSELAPILAARADKARAVLCFIRAQAQRRAKADTGTVVGSNMLDVLFNNFLDDYLANPNTYTGQAAIAEISEPQGFPAIGFGAAMYIPKGVRDRYPNFVGDWEWIYPATQFWSIRKRTDDGSETVSVGDKCSVLNSLNVPFLVGTPTTVASDDDDAIKGGKNLSNVMHWATGMRYHYLPDQGMREIFIGYELWHLEAWDVFGEDPINDLIAEEQGRLFGKRLATASAKTQPEIIAGLDEDFRTARAWVGAMLRLRKDRLDELVLQKAPPIADMWTGHKRVSAPWVGESVQQQLDSGKTVEQVCESDLARHLIEIYTLIYYADEWERKHGDVGLSDVMKKCVAGDYDGQFKAAPKGYGAKWDWNP